MPSGLTPRPLAAFSININNWRINKALPKILTLHGAMPENPADLCRMAEGPYLQPF